MDPQFLGRRIGSWLLMRELARRGVALLFEAVHMGTGAVGIVKLIARVSPDDPAYERYAERLLREARALSQASHPTLPRVLDFGHLEDGRAYLLTEHRRGEWLGERLGRREGPLPVAEALAILGQLAAALAGLPEQFDLSPDDLLLYPDEGAPGGRRARLASLGALPLLPGPRPPLPHTGSLLPGDGTYLAPELCRGGAPDERSAVYALGVLGYRLLAGCFPFSGDAFEVRGLHLSARPAPLRQLAPALPADLAALLEGALEKEPEDRPALAELGEALSAWSALAQGSAQVSAQASLPVPVPAAGHAAPARARLVLLSGAERREFPLRDVETIGRDPSCSVPLHDRILAREHAQVVRQRDGSYLLRDLGSLHGTYVRGQRVTEHALRPGDELAVGGARLLFTLASQAEEPAPPPARLSGTSIPTAAAVPAAELAPEYERLRRALLLGRRLLDAPDPEERVLRLLDGAGPIVGAHRGAALRLAGGRFVVLEARCYHSTATASAPVSPPAAALAEAREGVALLSPDAATDDRFAGDQQVLREGVRSLLVLPLRQGDEPWGALYLDSQVHAALFGERERELLQLLADVAMR